MTLIAQDSRIDYSKELTIFTDGSALNNSKTSPAGWGVYIPLIKKALSKGIIGTNNQAELEALRVALWYFKAQYEHMFKSILERVNTHDTIYIISDSEYGIKAVTGINKVNTNKASIDASKELIEYIQNTLHIWVRFIHVNSHTNGTDFMSINNAIVDELARKKAEEMKINTNGNNQK